jgi:hypothetical protein
MSALGQKQTCAAHKPMSAKCQKRTSVLYDILLRPLIRPRSDDR